MSLVVRILSNNYLLKEVVAVDARYYCPTEVDLRIGDPAKSDEPFTVGLQV
nr:hypothetical protein [Candidatus Brachybacter algidus]